MQAITKFFRLAIDWSLGEIRERSQSKGVMPAIKDLFRI